MLFGEVAGFRLESRLEEVIQCIYKRTERV